MFTLLKLLQSLIKTLHSDGTPGQIAAGMALGAALGLTPIANVHNVVILALLCVLNVSFAAGVLGGLLFTPLGFLLDPLFDATGRQLLLDTPALTPLWTSLDNAPLVPFTNFNNSVVLGSVVWWAILALPIYLLARAGVMHYRTTLGERVRQTRFYQTIRASQLYNVYRWFQA